MDYFANEAQVAHAGGFELQNRLDRISLGSGDITRDEAGLQTVRALAEHLQQIEATLVRERDAGQLPKRITDKPATPAGNVFGMKRPRSR